MTSTENSPVTLKDMKDYFGYAKLSDFAADWKALSSQDKEDIKKGLSDGTYNY